MPGDEHIEALRIGQTQQLFVDDYILEDVVGLKRTLHAVQKHAANPVLRPEHPWEGNSIEYTTVRWDATEKRYQAWYAVGDNMDPRSPPGAKSRSTTRTCYATSADGIHWEKPDLGLVPFDGSRANNVIATADNRGLLQSVVYVAAPDEPDERRRYKLIFHRAGGYHVAFSPDGIRWTEHPENPVWRIPGDVAPTIYDPAAGGYVSFAKMHDEYEGFRRRLVGRATSRDFVVWSEPRLILRPDEQDEGWTLGRPGHHTEFYGLCGFPYAGMYLGLLWVFRVTGKVPGGTNYGSIHVELAHSRDGLHWQRAFSRRPLIGTGPQEGFDSAYMHASSPPSVVGDELWLYYDGHDGDHGSYWYFEPWGSDEPRRGGAVGLGRLRLDGFVAMTGGPAGGHLTTKPLLVDGGALLVNAQLRDGTLRVELLDPEGSVHPGLSAAECVPFDGDSVRHRIVWKGGGTLEALRDRPMRLRFYLTNGDLYSFRWASD